VLHATLTGVLHDKTYEDRIEELEARIEALQADNARLRNENIILTNELRDRQNIINSYEQGVVYKRGDDPHDE
jgi:hypothetical protein